MGNSTTTQSSTGTSSTSPWTPQANQLKNAFSDAENIYNQRSAQGSYTGQYVAGLTPEQEAAISGATGYSGGEGAGLQSNAGGLSAELTGNGALYAQNAENLANGVAGPNGADMGVLQGAATGQGVAGVGQPNAGLSTALNTAAVNGANAIGGYNTGLSTALTTAAGNPTAAIDANAGTYMNSAPIQQALNSTNATIQQTLNDQTLPGLNQSAANGGNLNSSRAGAENAMALQGAAVAEGNADSNIENNAFNTGLSTASTNYNADLNAQIQGNESGLNLNDGIAQGQQASQIGQSEFGTNTALNAANSGLSAGLNYEGLNASTEEAGNNELGTGLNTGLSAAQEAQTLAGGNYALGSTAGSLAQAGNQAALTNQQDAYQEANTYQQGLLQNYYGIIGANNWGGNTTSSTTGTQTQQASPVSSALGAAAGVGSMFASGGLFGSGGSFSGLFGNNDPWV